MKGFPRPSQILDSPIGTPYYGVVKASRYCYALADIHPGKGFHPVVKLDIEKDGEAEQFFYDLYQQLKGIFENISNHN